MNTYAYLCHAASPLGVGDDDDGDHNPEAVILGLKYSRISLPHGTMLRRACARLDAVNIKKLLFHTIPPHPESELGLLMRDHCYAHHKRHREKAAEMYLGDVCLYDYPHPIGKEHGDVCYKFLNEGNERVWECDGSYEEAVQDACKDRFIVAGSSINALALYMKAMALFNSPPFSNLQEHTGKFIHSDHPVLKHIEDLYPEYIPNGRSMDIWNPHIIDVLELAYKSLFGPGRKIDGLWLHLGGPFLWGETCHDFNKNIYYLNTPYAKEALGRDTDIDMGLEGRYYAPVIARRLGRLAVDLVERLRPLCKEFYFHVFHINPYEWKPNHQAMGMPGTMQALCDRLSSIPDVKIHMICSHAHECSVYAAAHVEELQREFPNIDFMAGVGWEHNLRTSGMARICEGYSEIEVGIDNSDAWIDLPAAITRLRQYEKLF